MKNKPKSVKTWKENLTSEFFVIENSKGQLLMESEDGEYYWPNKIGNTALSGARFLEDEAIDIVRNPRSFHLTDDLGMTLHKVQVVMTIVHQIIPEVEEIKAALAKLTPRERKLLKI